MNIRKIVPQIVMVCAVVGVASAPVVRALTITTDTAITMETEIMVTTRGKVSASLVESLA